MCETDSSTVKIISNKIHEQRPSVEEKAKKYDLNLILILLLDWKTDNNTIKSVSNYVNSIRYWLIYECRVLERTFSTWGQRKTKTIEETLWEDLYENIFVVFRKLFMVFVCVFAFRFLLHLFYYRHEIIGFRLRFY